MGFRPGAGTARFSPNLANTENIKFDAAITLHPDTTATIARIGGTTTNLGAGAISIAGNKMMATIAASELPTTGFLPNQYTFNLWPRLGTGNNNHGLAQGMIQRLLEARYTDTDVLLNREDPAGGMDAVRDIKVARGKIRKRIVGNEWHAWDGYVPTRHVRIEKIDANDLLTRVLPEPSNNRAINSLFSYQNVPCVLNGPSLGHVCAAIGMKGRGKSHLTKLIILALTEKKIPVLAFDLNHEYEELPNAQVLRWKQNFWFSLSELGMGIVSTLVRAMNPLKETSEAAFEHCITDFYERRYEACEKRGQRCTIDIPYLKSQFAKVSSMNEWVRSSIMERLDQLEPLFLREVDASQQDREIADQSMLKKRYDAACTGSPLVFDLGGLSPVLRGALVKTVIKTVERICEAERKRETYRFPYLVFDEGHLYLTEDALLSIVTRVRHTGLGCFIASDTPQKLPSDVFRQLDNLFLLGLSHDGDIRAVAETSITDTETIKCLANRLPSHHALIVGTLTSEYPLVVTVSALPKDVRASGVTRSPWDAIGRNFD